MMPKSTRNKHKNKHNKLKRLKNKIPKHSNEDDKKDCSKKAETTWFKKATLFLQSDETQAAIDLGLTVYGVSMAVTCMGSTAALFTLTPKLLDIGLNHSKSLNVMKDMLSNSRFADGNITKAVTYMSEKAEIISQKVPNVLKQGVKTVNDTIYMLEGISVSAFKNLANGVVSASDATKCTLTTIGLNTMKNNIADLNNDIKKAKEEASQSKKNKWFGKE